MGSFIEGELSWLTLLWRTLDSAVPGASYAIHPAQELWSFRPLADGLVVGLIMPQWRRCSRRRWAEVAAGGVAAGRVVPGFDPGEHRAGESGAGGPRVVVEEFALQRREERPSDGVVERVANGAHCAEQAGLAEALPEHP